MFCPVLKQSPVSDWFMKDSLETFDARRVVVILFMNLMTLFVLKVLATV